MTRVTDYPLDAPHNDSPAQPAPALQLHEVVRTYRSGADELHVLRNAELALWPGQSVALIAPSGAGKSTLLHLAGLLERPDAGEIYMGDMPTAHMDDAQRTRLRRLEIGFVYQFHHLLPEFTAQENVMMPQLIRGLSMEVAQSRASELLGYLGLGERLLHRPAELSGGEQQRVAIARALLTSPQLLLMDEPLSSLDVGRKREILPHIENLPRTFNVPVLYVTHNIDEVVRLADDVVLLAAGRVAAHGSVTDVFERGDVLSLTGGLDAGSVLRTRVIEHRNGIATLALGAQHLRVPTAALPVGTGLPIRIHARDVAIATQRPQHLSIRNILAATILRVEPTTSMNVDIVLDIDGEHLRSRITRDALEELGLEEGQAVFALIKSVALESTLLG